MLNADVRETSDVYFFERLLSQWLPDDDSVLICEMFVLPWDVVLLCKNATRKSTRCQQKLLGTIMFT